MPIDPELREYLAAVASAVPPISSPTPDARRARMEQIARLFPFPADQVARQDRWLSVPGREIFMRIYRYGSGRLPAILFLHGGGWVAGSVNTHDGICAALAKEADAVVVTAKDHVKLARIWRGPPLWVLGLELEVVSGAERLLESLRIITAPGVRGDR